MTFQLSEILESLSFVSLDHFDIRTVTLGVSLRECQGVSDGDVAARVYERLTKVGGNLVPTVNKISERYNIPVANRRIAVSPVSMLCEGHGPHAPMKIARAIDRAAKALGVDYVGGFSALIERGITRAENALIDSLPEVLSRTERLCSSFNVATTRSGLNLDAIHLLAGKILQTAEATRDLDAIGCSKIVVFANAVEDNPFMAGAFHGVSLGDEVVHVGISGPGVIRQVLENSPQDLPLDEVAERIKKASFKMTRVGELFLRECSRALGYTKGIIDISLAPTPEPGDSVANILEEIGVERTGAPGTTTALALLSDAVKKGGTMAASRVGGLSGAFIPVSEDEGMIRAASEGALTLEKLESLTCVCSVGLDMIAVPGDIPHTSLTGLIADACTLGMVNNKTTGVRIIPVPGKSPGDIAVFGGLFGEAPILPVSKYGCERLVNRGGFIPTPMQGFRN